ncbi:MAG: Kelch repeat-containing protein, partial [Nocardioidaceae bacterium]
MTFRDRIRPRPKLRAALAVAALSIGTSTALSVPAATADAADAAGTVTLSGVVRDGSGHSWPMWAKVSVEGLPGAVTYTTPANGHYSLEVPADSTYTVHVDSKYPGYRDLTTQGEVASRNTVANLRTRVDADSCVAPGYRYMTNGLIEGFGQPSTPPGWTVVDNLGNDQVWAFDDPGERGNHTGGHGGFAIIDSDLYGWTQDYHGHQDTELVSPSVDLTDVTDPAIGFNSDFTMWDYDEPSGIGDVDLSVDGGSTWQNVWRVDASTPGPAAVRVPIPSAAGEPDVRVRFHYHETDITAGRWWAVDSVYVGNRSCDPVHGGLALGQVRDANTDAPVVGATVQGAGATTTSVATPADDRLGDGFYWMFAPQVGQQQLKVSKRLYHQVSQQVDVEVDWAAHTDLELKAGQLSVRPSLASTQRLGRSKHIPLTVTNTGTAPADVTVAERPGDFHVLAAKNETQTAKKGESSRAAADTPEGAPLQRIKGTFLPTRSPGPGAVGGRDKPKAAAADSAWASVAEYPISTRDNVAAYQNGKVYSIGGASTQWGYPIVNSYAYDAAADDWSRIADSPVARQSAAAEFIGGKLYVTDGWSGQFGQQLSSELDIYDPATNSWTQGPDIPVAMASAASAVLDGQMYVVGGCDDQTYCGSQTVLRYDPAGQTWEKLADYPEPVSWLSCGAIEAKVYCAGGVKHLELGPSVPTTSTYVYDPGSNTWTHRADLPTGVWGAGSTVAGGRLLVSGGVIDSMVTNQGFGYDPVSDSWQDLPNAANATFRGGSACGFYTVAGGDAWAGNTSFVQVLPGHSDCGSDRDSPWLSESSTQLTLQPGESQHISVGLDGSVVNQPGTYDAAVLLRGDTPYGMDTVDVTLHLSAPRRWGKVSGTVTEQTCSGGSGPLGSANVWVNTWIGSHTLSTDAGGSYAWWLDVRNNPLNVVAGKDGWLPDNRKVRIRPGKVTRADF